MDFFEVLLVLIFIVIPLLEGVFKQRRKGQGGPVPTRRPAEASGGGDTEVLGEPRELRGESGLETADDAPATDMIPADLWEVLTGEKRQPPRTPAPWEEEEAVEAEISWEELEPEVLKEETGTGWDDWRTAETPGERPAAKSLEYVGPEAITLEVPPPAPEVRHRRFHEKYDQPIMAPAPNPAPRARDLWTGLEGGELRRSVLLAEILGPPKGLS